LAVASPDGVAASMTTALTKIRTLDDAARAAPRAMPGRIAVDIRAKQLRLAVDVAPEFVDRGELEEGRVPLY
jgi:hypothetical protein